MSEEQPREEQREEQLEEQRPLPLVRSLTYGTGTFLAAGIVDLLAHLGPTGLVVGGIAAYVAAQHGPELVERVREAFPPRADGQPTEGGDQQGEGKKQQHGVRRLIDRALGRLPEARASPPPEGTAQAATAPGPPERHGSTGKSGGSPPPPPGDGRTRRGGGWRCTLPRGRSSWIRWVP